MTRDFYLKYFELFIITIIFPFIIITLKIQKLVIPIVIVIGILSLYYLIRKKYSFRSPIILNKKIIQEMLLRILLNFIMLFFLVYLFLDKFLILPYLNFKLWLLLIIIYPIISVLPQELFFRAFFFQRYSLLFKNKNYLILTNAIIFSFVHSIYLNNIIVILTFFGGIIFARNYYYNKSLFLVTIEHSLLGIFVFSIGLGYYFHESNIKYIYSIL